MKTILIFSVFFFMHSVLCNAQVDFVKFDWEEIKKNAAQDNKFIMVDMTATWCYWCKVMEKKVFPDKKVGEYFNANFISSKLYDTDPMAENFSKKYNVNSFPTFLFFDSKGNLINKMEGAVTKPKDFIYEGKQVTKK